MEKGNKSANLHIFSSANHTIHLLKCSAYASHSYELPERTHGPAIARSESDLDNE